MELGITGKRALVTGGAQGIGQAISLELAKEGACVAFTSRQKDAINKTMALMPGPGKNHCGILADISAPSGPFQVFEEVSKTFGEIDILVNNVGHTLDVTDPYCSIEDWRRVFRLNFEIAVEMSNLCLPYMKRQDWGRIVNITSCAGLENSGPVTFSAAKAALTAYTRSMGRVLATENKNVVMTALSPGIVITEGGHWDTVMKERPEHAEKYIRDRAPLGRFGNINEISPIVALLCSEKASFCHAGIFPVDAGQSKHYMYFNYM